VVLGWFTRSPNSLDLGYRESFASAVTARSHVIHSISDDCFFSAGDASARDNDSSIPDKEAVQAQLEKIQKQIDTLAIKVSIFVFKCLL
jgi:hypothetical protein